mgnify:CR=1 FL=1
MFQLLKYMRDHQLHVHEDSISFASHSCLLQPKYNKTEFAKGVAPLIFGGFMILTSLTSISLPETNNVKIPETAKEANRLKWNFK